MLELVKAGTDFQIRETFESALVMGREALIRLGDDADLAEEMIANMRERDMNRFALECVGGIFAGRDLVIFNKPQPETA